MSMASRYAEMLREAHAALPQRFEAKRKTFEGESWELSGIVTDKGDLRIVYRREEGILSPADAIRFARWILTTFTDPPELP